MDILSRRVYVQSFEAVCIILYVFLKDGIGNVIARFKHSNHVSLKRLTPEL